MGRRHVSNVPELIDRIADIKLRCEVEIYHAQTCIDSHSDECGWLYEELESGDVWSKPAHKLWLEQLKHLNGGGR